MLREVSEVGDQALHLCVELVGDRRGEGRNVLEGRGHVVRRSSEELGSCDGPLDKFERKGLEKFRLR